MRSFFICISALAFLLSELIGLLQGLSTLALLGRSIVVFAFFFIFGEAFSMFFNKTQEPEADSAFQESAQQSREQAAAGAQELAADQMKKDEVIRHAAGNPKETAHVINTLISQ